MGYIRIDKFDDIDVWERSIPVLDIDDPDYEKPLYHISQVDWPENLTTDKDRGVRFDFDGSVDFENEEYVYTKYSQPKVFSFRDKAGVPFNYDSLIFSYMLHSKEVSSYGKVEDFFFSLELLYEGQQVREWFLELSNRCCGYGAVKLDLKPLVEKGLDKFDEVRIHFLRHPGYGAVLYLGDLWFFQDEVVHNTTVAVASLFHNKIVMPLTKLSRYVKQGEKGIPVFNSSRLYENEAIVIGDMNGVYEIHSITGIDYSKSQNEVILKLSNEYDGETLLSDWAEETEVFLIIPAIYGENRDREAIVPCFYIATEAPTLNEQYSRLGYARSNYVRDPGGEHEVAVHIEQEAIELPVSVYVFAPSPEIAADMWRYVRKIFNSRSRISISGVGVDYEVVGDRMLPSDDKGMPFYVMELIVYSFENPHDLTYKKFTGIKVLTIGSDLIYNNFYGFSSVEAVIEP